MINGDRYYPMLTGCFKGNILAMIFNDTMPLDTAKQLKYSLIEIDNEHECMNSKELIDKLNQYIGEKTK